mmetsp:Transcript_16655/g.42720  ORF Transcript_16655/g.42720 Transcript_16655/m.42720 type:complete len:218 (-) Transcript_16655:415-1068(-)
MEYRTQAALSVSIEGGSRLGSWNLNGMLSSVGASSVKGSGSLGSAEVSLTTVSAGTGYTWQYTSFSLSRSLSISPRASTTCSCRSRSPSLQRYLYVARRSSEPGSSSTHFAIRSISPYPGRPPIRSACPRRIVLRSHSLTAQLGSRSSSPSLSSAFPVPQSSSMTRSTRLREPLLGTGTSRTPSLGLHGGPKCPTAPAPSMVGVFSIVPHTVSLSRA